MSPCRKLKSLSQVTWVTIFSCLLGLSAGASPTMSGTATGAVDEDDINSGTVIGRAVTLAYTWSDTDGDTLAFTKSGADAAAFSYVSPNSPDLVTALDLDAETKNSYTFDILVSDGTTTVTQPVTITINDINEYDPKCTPTAYFNTIPENSAGGVLVATLTSCTDDDVTDSIASQSIASGDDAAVKFALSGATTVQTSATPLDYETKSNYILEVELVDTLTPVRTGTVSIIVQVSPMDDNSPTWATWSPAWVSIPADTTIIDESVPLGTLIITAAAIDADLPANGPHSALTYSITASFDRSTNAISDYFYINPNTGDIFNIRELREGREPYRITVEVTDGTTTLTRTFEFEVDDNINNAPDFEPGYYSVSIPEGSASGTSIQLLTARDDDSFFRNEHSFSIVSIVNQYGYDASSYFTLNTDVVEVARTLNEAFIDPYFRMKVSVFDGKYTDYAYIYIEVTEINKATPTWSTWEPGYVTAITPYDIPEDSALDTSVVTILAEDGDNGDQGEILYSIISVKDDNGGLVTDPLFRLDPVSGEIRTLGSFDFESVPYYTVRVQAVDQGTPQKSVTRDLRVGITDVNDNVPQFSQPAYSAVTLEGDAVGTSVIQLSGTDADLTRTFTATYTITNGDPLGKFSFSGDLMELAKVIDLDEATYDPDAYQLTVELVDELFSPRLTATTTVYVSVTPKNQHLPMWSVWAPTYASAPYVITEDDAASTSIVTISATDRDYSTDGLVTYSLVSALDSSSGSVADMFDLNPTTGVLETAQLFDYETEQTYTIVVRATDGAGSSVATDRSFDITVTDVNDNAPGYTATSFYFGISEGTATNTLIHTFTPADLDSAFTFSHSILAAGNIGNHFRMDGAMIETDDVLDLDPAVPDNDFYTLVVVVTDEAGAGALSGTTTLYISVTAVNQHTPAWAAWVPAWTTATTPHDIPEDTASGTLIVTVDATDADTGTDGDVKYYISSVVDSTSTAVPQTLFSLDEDTGELDAIGPFDYETMQYYDLVIRVEDQGAGPLSDTRTMRVGITDINDNRPTLDQAIYHTTVTEGDGIATPVQTVTASDVDSSATFSYSITAGNTAAKFGVNPSGATCVIEVAAVIDLDGGDSDQYELVIEVTDEAGVGALTGTATVYVTVISSNDHTPVWGAFTPAYVNPTTPYNLNEDVAVETSILTMTATDADTGEDGQIRFELLSAVDSASAAVNMFRVDSSTGELFTTAALDYETETFYDLVVKVKDMGVPERTATQSLRVGVLDINDETPHFLPQDTYHVTAAETAGAGTSIMQFLAGDNDVSITPTYTYSIQNGNALNRFRITGDELEINTVIDLDVGVADPDEYELEVIVTDQAGPGDLTGTAMVYVKVLPANDHSPVFGTWSPAWTSPTAPYNINEDAAVGTSIVTVVANDDDFGEALTYSITTAVDNEGTNSLGKFRIGPASGEVQSADFFDREGGTSGITHYDITVSVSDGTNTITRGARVGINDVNDNPPVFTQQIYDFTTTEGAGVATLVGQVVVTDADPTAVTHTYTITGGNGDGKFQLRAASPDTVEIATVIDLDAGSSDPDSYILTLEASDGVNTGTTSVYIRVTETNDHTPIFNPAGTNLIPENSPVGTSAGIAQATDDDFGDSGVITYSITGGDADNLFEIHPVTGDILLKNLADYETMSANPVNLQITATDGGAVPKSAVQTVPITVTDVNDNPPLCTSHSYVETVPENSATGTTVVQLSCSDADSGETLAYTIFSGDTGGDFSLDATGLLLTVNLLQYDGPTQEYTLVLHVKDNAATHTATVQVAVAVGPVNEFTPTFAPVTNTITFSETTGIGGALITKVATDADYSPHNIRTYEIVSVSGGNTATFQVDPVTGLITLAKSLHLASSPYEIVVRATDGASVVGSGTVSVVVTDENNNTPTCSPAAHNIEIPENQAVGVLIASLGCTDPDTGVYGTITYSVTQSPGSGDFTVSAGGGTGDLSLAVLQDYESGITSYQLEVTAADDGGSGNAVIIPIRVTITAVNEGGPAFGGPYAVRIAENLAIGGAVADAVATDPDGPTHPHGNPQYSITAGDTNNQFLIDPATGHITVAAELDRETTASYSLTVKALEEIGTNSATVTVDITIADVDDNTPVCSLTTFSTEIPESTTAPFTLATLGCTDVDTSSTLSYTLLSGDATKFSVSASGVVQLIQALDFDLASRQFDLTVRVSDSATSPHTVDARGTVLLTGVNEHTPVFVQVDQTQNVAEDEGINTQVVTVTATDADSADTADGQVIYSMVSGATPEFKLLDSGGILLVADLDRETTDQYVMLIRASDGTNSATATVTINVLDINDNAPVFLPRTYSMGVIESTGAGTPLLTVTATDADDLATNNNAAITYTITSGNTGQFSMNSATGVLSLAAMLDYETAESHTLEVTARDRNGLTGYLEDKAIIILTVDPVNEHDPFYAPATYTATVPEGLSLSTVIATVSATDADIGVDGEISYSMAASALFGLDALTGEIYLKGELDYETATSHTLTVTATDGGSPARSADTTVTITVTDDNDNYPVCSPSSFSDTQREDVTTATTVATLSCTDADTGPGGTLAYAISSVNGNAGTGNFAISGAGVVTIATALDYETTVVHDIIVQVSDTSGSPLTSIVLVVVTVTDVNEHTPTFLAPPPTTSMGETTAVGTNIISIVASDLDTQDTISYSFNPANSYFMIDPATGEIRLKSPVDRESVSSVTLTIEAVDSGTVDAVKSATHTLTVNIVDANDSPPTFSPASYNAAIDENDSTNTVVVTVSASDPDQGVFGDVSYSIVGGNSDAIFRVDKVLPVGTGDVIIDDVTNLDYESATLYSLVIEAVDGGGNIVSTTVAVTINPINEHTPVFTPSATYTQNVLENTAPGSTVETITATDADDGLDGTIEYSITSGGTHFSIDPQTGDITLTSELDRETAQMHTVIIQASDKGVIPGVLSASATFSLTVTDYNDHAPVCTPTVYVASIPEDAASGDPVTTISCVDNDLDPLGVNDAFTFAIVGGSTDFAVDANTGAVTVAPTAALDYETSDSFTLIVRVTDGGAPAQSTDTTVNIHITGINEHTPVFSSDPYTVSVVEDTALGTSVGQVTATDADDGLDGDFSYSIASGDPNNVFVIDDTSGDVTLIKELDRETLASYDLVIHATDDGVTARTGSTTMSITVTDTNDNPPVCSDSVYTGTVIEHSATGVPVTTVSCTDSDLGVNGQVRYSITGGPTGTPFQINLNTGVVAVLMSAAADAETSDVMTLTVEATDLGAPALTTAVSVVITLTDINEFLPVFLPTLYSVTVNENEPPGSTVTTVTATDADTGINGEITYSITLGNTAALFYIDPASGVISLQDRLDYETVTLHVLTVLAADKATPSLSASATVSVTVGDYNDNNPLCPDTPFNGDVNEDAAPSFVILTVTCTDADTDPPSAKPQYTIIAGDPGNQFAIDIDTGDLSVNAALDYETTTTYFLAIQVHDMGTPSLSSTTQAIVSINPVNEFVPVITTTALAISIDEDTVLLTNVIDIDSTDNDDGVHGEVTYSIPAGNSQNHFAISSTTGIVYVSSALDREATDTYTLTVRATDSIPGNGDQRSAEVNVVITVLDINDNNPVFVPAVYAVNVLEGAAVGSTIMAVTVTDDDIGVNGQHQFSILSGNTGGAFNVSGANIVIEAALDHDVLSQYDLRIEAADLGTPSLTSTAKVVINVLSENEFPPVLSSTADSITVSEDAPVGSSLFTVTATDADKNTAGVIKYYIVDGDPTGVTFLLEPDTGELTLGSFLDYDTPPQVYSLNISAVDMAGGASSMEDYMTLTVTLVDVNDQSPVFTMNTYIQNIDEDIGVNTVVTTVTALDLDTGINGQVKYSIEGGDGGGYFTLQSSTGKIRTAANLDREIKDTYNLLIEARDQGTPQHLSFALVKITLDDVNDNAPVFSPYSFVTLIDENEQPGSFVCPVFASDPDLGNNALLTFAIDPSTDPNGHFLITQTGTNTANITTSTILDRENIEQYNLLITATDFGPTRLIGTASVTILVHDLNDNTPFFISPSYDTSISEASDPGTTVFHIQSIDPDKDLNSHLLFSIISGDRGGFYIDEDTGVVTTRTRLDRENIDLYTMVVEVTDYGSPNLTATVSATVTIQDINDNAPQFTQPPVFYVDEGVQNDSLVGKLYASDPDAGANGTLIYSLMLTSQGHENDFRVEGDGTINTNTDTLDREDVALYILKVRVTDGGTPMRYMETDVQIVVNDVNDNKPVCDKSVFTGTISEDSVGGIIVANVSATDADQGSNALVSYSLDPSASDPQNYFTVNSYTGQVTLSKPPDREVQEVYSFNVIASDNGATHQTTACLVSVTITDINDNAPAFEKSFYSLEVAVDDSINHVIATIRAVDPDSNPLVMYQLDTASNELQIGSVSGNLTKSSSDTLPPNSRYVVMVSARDTGIPALSSTAKVRVDTFVASLHVVVFYMEISEIQALGNQEQFRQRLTATLQASYPTATVQVWKINTWKKDSATSRRRKLLQVDAAQTSDYASVYVYAVTDDSTYNESNVNSDKVFMPVEELLSQWRADAETGAPATRVQGETFEDYSIVRVQDYAGSEALPWVETDEGLMIIIIVSIVALLILLAIILAIYFCCCRKRQRKRKPVQPIQPTPLPPVEESSFEPRYKLDKADTERQKFGINDNPKSNLPAPTVFVPIATSPRKPPPKVTEPWALVKSRRANVRQDRDSPEEEAYYDATAVDPDTGRVYEYNSRTFDRRWVTASDSPRGSHRISHQ